jgi:hypothetical protein
VGLALSIDEVESFISQISCGGKLAVIENASKEKMLFFFQHPTARDLVMADFVRARAVEKALSEGLPSVPEMEEILVKRGLWSKEKDDSIVSLERQREAQKVLLRKTTRIKANRDRIKNNIKGMDKKIWEIRREKEAYLIHTRERRAEEEKLLYLAWACSFDFDLKDRYWETLDEFFQEPDILFRTRVSVDYSIFSMGIPNETIRYIARQPLWRMRFMSSQKSGARLFGRDVCDYSVDMLNITYWSSFYASLSEMMATERPPEDIIEDDDSLDAFMESYYKEQSSKDAEARSRKTTGKSSAWDHDETIVMSSNPVFSDIEYTETVAEKLRRRGDVATTDIKLDKEHRR